MLLCFDYDGVIVDSFDALLDIARRAHAGIGSGRPPEAEDFRTIEELTFDALAARLGVAADHVRGYAEAVFALQNDADGYPVALFDGMAAVLQALAAQHTVVVITASSTATVQRSLERLGVAPHVHQVLGGEQHQSKAERIRAAMAASGSEAADTWMIGDAISDIRHGKAAGVRTAAVTWGYQAGELLAREAPDRMVDSPAALLTLA